MGTTVWLVENGIFWPKVAQKIIFCLYYQYFFNYRERLRREPGLYPELSEREHAPLSIHVMHFWLPIIAHALFMQVRGRDRSLSTRRIFRFFNFFFRPVPFGKGLLRSEPVKTWFIAQAFRVIQYIKKIDEKTINKKLKEISHLFFDLFFSITIKRYFIL